MSYFNEKIHSEKASKNIWQTVIPHYSAPHKNLEMDVTLFFAENLRLVKMTE